MSSRTIGIGLVGCGVVGTGVLEILQSHASVIEKRLGAGFSVRQIAVRDLTRSRAPIVASHSLTDDPFAVARNPEVDIVVELMGGLEPAGSVVREALELGKQVVTANKALLAEKGDELFDLARQQELDLCFEASVAGGIPIIRTLQESLAGDEIVSIEGIINGTSNYVLSEMAEHGHEFAVALKAAQAAGYAEADPTLDVSGGDAAHKLAILATLAFGVRVHPEHIAIEGINVVDASDIEYAYGFDYAIRPVAVARRSASGLDLRVHPALIPADAPLSHVTGALNAVTLTGVRLGTCFLSGPGAGAGPTATGVVGDLVDMGRNILHGASGRVPSFVHDEDAEPKLVSSDDLESSYYLRFTVRDQPGVLSAITGALGEFSISIEKMFQNVDDSKGGSATVVMITHESTESGIREALDTIDRLPHTLAPTRLLRILD